MALMLAPSSSAQYQTVNKNMPKEEGDLNMKTFENVLKIVVQSRGDKWLST